ncbi:MAG: DUF1207 domain-containing protein [Verrucomicrobia bacterium]|nr:DUF1207 domain-containing protein [Verrucomicrobiota bacterium]
MAESPQGELCHDGYWEDELCCKGSPAEEPCADICSEAQPCCDCCLDVADDLYMQGYLQALIDLHYHEHCVTICYECGIVYVANLPNNCLVARSIMQFLADFPGVQCVIVDQCCEKCKPVVHPTVECDCCKIGGIWFPQSTLLYQPMIADPRQVMFGGAYRFHDQVLGSRVGVAKFGDCFPFFRWLEVGPLCGDAQIGIEAGVWAVFKFGDKNLEGTSGDKVALINADYLVGVPLTYAAGNYSFRLRPYHISSHLGDEFLCHMEAPADFRVNPSREAIDFFTSYQLSEALRLYAGIGYNFHSNMTFPIKPWYVEYGGELRLLGHRNLFYCLYVQPFFAFYIRNWQDTNWEFDGTYLLGFEASKLQGLGRKMRIYLEWHDGFCFEGQFSKLRDHYFAACLAYGF